jgi:hypothetical protein
MTTYPSHEVKKAPAFAVMAAGSPAGISTTVVVCANAAKGRNNEPIMIRYFFIVKRARDKTRSILGASPRCVCPGRYDPYPQNGEKFKPGVPSAVPG